MAKILRLNNGEYFKALNINRLHKIKGSTKMNISVENLATIHTHSRNQNGSRY